MAIRTDVLASFGADARVTKEFLRYNEYRFDQVDLDRLGFPLPDESLVAAWQHMLLKPMRRTRSPEPTFILTPRKSESTLWPGLVPPRRNP